MKKLLICLLALTLLAACAKSTTGEPLSETRLVIGVTPGPHEEVMELVKEMAAEDGLEIELRVFTEYVLPNIALAEGDIDINIFQHKPYLDNFKAERNLDLVDVGPTINFPMGVYSTQVSSLEELKPRDKVGLPNDPTNGARALILFEAAGLISLTEGVGVAATVYDIQDNPLNLQFIELEAPQIPRQLDELTAAAINSNFAIEYGFVPTQDSIFIEPGDSPWVNVIAVRTENKDDPVIQTLLQYYHSDRVREFILERFQGSIVPAWETDGD